MGKSYPLMIDVTRIKSHDINYINEDFFKNLPQATHLDLSFTELIYDLRCVLKHLPNVTDLSLEGFSPSYKVLVDFSVIKKPKIKNLTLINCVIVGESLAKLKLDSLSICNCTIFETGYYLDDYVSKLNLIELHDLSDEYDMLRESHCVKKIDEIGYRSFMKSTRLKKLTIQFANHSHEFSYPDTLEQLTITNTNNANVMIRCNSDVNVILT